MIVVWDVKHQYKHKQFNLDLAERFVLGLILVYYMDYKPIYTEGSKDDMKVGCTVVSDDFSETMRIPDGSSIFTAEAKALGLALDHIADCETSNKILYFQTPYQY